MRSFPAMLGIGLGLFWTVHSVAAVDTDTPANNPSPVHGSELHAPILTQIDIRLVAESGFLGVVDHRIRFSGDDRSFRYHEEGGQDVLFPFLRLSAELTTAQRHTVVFLYQPLALETRVKMPDDLRIGGVEFQGGNLDLLYSFPFYRLSYLFRVGFGGANPPNREIEGARSRAVAGSWYLDLGGSLQIRNANTVFQARGGAESEGFFRSAGTGLVPLLKARMRYDLSHGFWLGAELDGIYAPVSYINGSDNDTVGALLDAALRVGYTVSDRLDTFFNVRYLGGGAANKDPGDYSVNWLNVVTVSLGASLNVGR